MISFIRVIYFASANCFSSMTNKAGLFTGGSSVSAGSTKDFVIFDSIGGICLLKLCFKGVITAGFNGLKGV